jgi:hypothetical protein
MATKRKRQDPTLSPVDLECAFHRLAPVDRHRIDGMCEDLAISVNLNRDGALQLLAAIGLLFVGPNQVNTDFAE